MQETYLRAYRSLGSFRGDAALTTWLYRIAANCSSTQLTRRSRSWGRHTNLDAAVQLADDSAEFLLEASTGSAPDRRALIRALRALPVSQRAVIVLSDVYDLPHEAIAAQLGISRAAVKVRLHRGRRRMRELLYPETISRDDEAMSSPPRRPTAMLRSEQADRAGSMTVTGAIARVSGENYDWEAM